MKRTISGPVAWVWLFKASSLGSAKIERARMEAESPTQAGRPAGAVFLSYASQDTEAAERICEALRTAGIEVWFDQSELRGGDACDQKIRREIHDCALFIPVISANTVLDPLDQESHFTLGMAPYSARRYREATTAFAEGISLNSDFTPAYVLRGLAFYGYGDLERARTSCETKREYWFSQWCLAMVYGKLGRHAYAEAGLAKMKDAQGDRAAFHYATIYAHTLSATTRASRRSSGS